MRFAFLMSLFFSCLAHGWDYEGHRMVNLVAVEALPTNFPAFVKTPEAKERIGFLSGEPDRWRSTPDYTLRHANNPDHYFDVEDLSDIGVDIKNLPQFRYVFSEMTSLGREKYKAKLKIIDPKQNQDRTRELIGFLPWRIAEGHAQVKAALSYWKAFKEAGTPQEIANAEQNVIFYMGVLGHYVGDAVQPLHSTRNFNGWVEANPKSYTTRSNFHSSVDGYPAVSHISKEMVQGRMRIASLLQFAGNGRADNVFPLALQILLKAHQEVVPLYELERGGKLQPNSEEGRKFIARQLTTGAQFLADLWQTAWVTAPPDQYLKSKLSQRQK